MEASAQDILARAGAAVNDAFAAFCEDIGGMFDVTADCTALSSGQGKAADLKKDFKKQISINHVQSKGAMQGTFDLMFDQAGTLVLAGVFVMLPEKRILEYVRSGYSGESDFITDAIKEAGNLLVGSWDRVYRKEMSDHQHFLQKGTAVGEPWTSPEDYFCFDPDADCFYSICQMTIDPYPPFKCAAIFPLTIFDPAGAAPVTAATADAAAETPAEPAASTEEVTAPTLDAADSAAPAAAEPDTAAAADTAAPLPAAATPDDAAASSTIESGTPAAAEKKPEADTDPAPGAVRAAIDAMVRPLDQAILRDDQRLSTLTAEQVMKPGVIWADPEDTVEQVMKRMQQNESAYVLVGRDQQIEGLVSRSVVTGAVSPYLRAMFAHLKRPLDDASLQIRIKWFMSRPVYSVGPQATLETVIHTMFKYGVRGLPVVGTEGRVWGFITVFDVLAALAARSDSPLLGKPAQTPMLL